MRYEKFLRCGLLAGMLGCAILAGCGKTLEEKVKTTEGPNGTTVQKEKVIQNPDGSITQQKESSTTRP